MDETKKSSLDNFAGKYVIGGELGFKSEYFKKEVSNILNFLKNHRNTKTCMIMVNEMTKNN